MTSEVARRSTLSAALLAGAFLATPAAAQDVNVAGTWNLEVTTDQGVTHPTVTFEQDGTTLTGGYSSEALGENRVEGTVAGSTVSWSFSASLQGQAIPVRYQGTVGDDGTMTGSIDIAGGMLTGSFKATRKQE